MLDTAILATTCIVCVSQVRVAHVAMEFLGKAFLAFLARMVF
jgi:hypothetical protein